MWGNADAGGSGLNGPDVGVRQSSKVLLDYCSWSSFSAGLWMYVLACAVYGLVECKGVQVNALLAKQESGGSITNLQKGHFQ